MNITIGGMGNSTIAGIMQNAQISTSENKSETKKEIEVKQSQANYDYVSADGDTLEISEAGKSAGKGNESQTGSGNAGTGSSATGSSIEGLENITTGTTSSSTSTSSVGDLSSYSESELKKMYLNGEITKAEYDEEISSRDTDE